jgi:carbon-monoxide dehydrogenase catalytic subunit
MPPVSGSSKVVGLLTNNLEDVLGAHFVVEEDPVMAAHKIVAHIEEKRLGLGLDARFPAIPDLQDIVVPMLVTNMVQNGSR